jgi:hypothetical protein
MATGLETTTPLPGGETTTAEPLALPGSSMSRSRPSPFMCDYS